jgi:hypothetical protein
MEMKKVLALFLALILCLSMVACGGGNDATNPTEAPDNSIELSLDNYADFLEIKAYVSPGEDIPADNDSFYDMNGKMCGASSLSSYMTIVAYAEGVSPNFIYSDIVIEVRATGKHILCDPNKVDGFSSMYASVVNADFTRSITCDLNVAGKGEGESDEKYTFPENMIMPFMMFADCYEFTCEIISISGKVTPVR